MAAGQAVDCRPRVGGIPQPQTVQEIEEVVSSALAKIWTVMQLLHAWDSRETIESGLLIAPRNLLDQAAEELFNIEYTA
jgi:hypothetical protein